MFQGLSEGENSVRQISAGALLRLGGLVGLRSHSIAVKESATYLGGGRRMDGVWRFVGKMRW
jgi:hypothetical protein